MAKIRLTKNELKKQKDDLKRFTRYLPTLELKKKQLLQEIVRIQQEADKLNMEIGQVEVTVSKWAGVLAEDVDLKEIVRVRDLQLDEGNIAAVVEIRGATDGSGIHDQSAVRQAHDPGGVGVAAQHDAKLQTDCE